MVATMARRPPIGTIAFDTERVIYLGNGNWQPFE
jgi:hypothetical protein